MSGNNQIPLQQVFTNTVLAMLNKIGLDRQLMVDRETYRLYVHDGLTKGGHAVAKVGDPTVDIRTIPFKGPDPVAGETWVMGEWPNDDNPAIKEPAYVAGAFEEYELTDEDIVNKTEAKGLVSGEQLSRLGGSSGGGRVALNPVSFSGKEDQVGIYTHVITPEDLVEGAEPYFIIGSLGIDEHAVLNIPTEAVMPELAGLATIRFVNATNRGTFTIGGEVVNQITLSNFSTLTARRFAEDVWIVSAEVTPSEDEEPVASLGAPLSAYWPDNVNILSPDSVEGSKVSYTTNNSNPFLIEGLFPGDEYVFQAKFDAINTNYGGKLYFIFEDVGSGSTPVKIVYDATTKELKAVDDNGQPLGGTLNVNANEVLTFSVILYPSGLSGVTVSTAGATEYFESTVPIPDVESLMFSTFYTISDVGDKLGVTYAWDKKDFFTHVVGNITTFASVASKNPIVHYQGADIDKVFSYTPEQIFAIASGGASSWYQIYSGSTESPNTLTLVLDRLTHWDVIVEAIVSDPDGVLPIYSLQFDFPILNKSFLSDIKIARPIKESGLIGMLSINAKMTGDLLLSITIDNNPSNLDVAITNVWKRIN